MIGRALSYAAFVAISAVAAAGDCPSIRLALPTGRGQLQGVSVACDGEVIAVGTPGDWVTVGTSRVFLLMLDGNGSGAAFAEVSAEGALPGDRFGYSIALDGPTLVVGAPWTYNVGLIDGAAYVFDMAEDGAWTQTARLIGARADVDPGTNEYFGAALAVQDDTILVGAYEGSEAYVYTRDALGEWNFAQRLTPIGDGGWYFGWSVALDGDLAVIGAPNDFEVSSYAGAAYVFQRDSAGVWLPVVKLLASDGRSLDGFGAAVAVESGTILVGSKHARDGSVSPGAVYVYERDGSGVWALIQRFTPPAGRNSVFFGTAIDVENALAVVGSESYAARGAAFVYQRAADRMWRLIGLLSAAEAQDGDRFGHSVALGDGIAVVGAPHHNLGGGYYGELAGSAYIFPVSRDEDGDGAMDACQCDADANFDGRRDLTDLAFLLSSFGRSGPDVGRTHGDFDNDRAVDLSDLAYLLARFGTDCP